MKNRKDKSMEKIKKLFIFLILIFLSCNLYAQMFTFDMQTCMQNILQKMQDAEHYVQTIKK